MNCKNKLLSILVSLLLISKCLFSQCDSCSIRVTGGINALCDSSQLDWATWGTVNSTTANGTISSNVNISVNMSTGGLATTSTMFNGSVFPIQYNVPVNTTAISNSLAGLFTFCFSVPVRDPQIAFASIGNPNTSVPIITSSCYQVIWAGIGMTYPNDTTMIGTEGFTIIKFPGTHTCLSFNYLVGEYYCNLAFGILDTNCQTIAPAPFCSGSNHADTLYANGAATYTWSPASGLNTSTGPVVIANPTATTTYVVTGTSSTGCTSTDSITVNVYPLPNVVITGSDSICSGGHTTLNAGSFSNYIWNNGATTQTINVTNTGTYHVTVTNANGCSSSDSLVVHLYSLSPPTITGNSAICQGNSTTINAGSYSNYNWSNGSTTQTTTISSAGTYTVTVTDANGCSATTSLTITIAPSAITAFINDSLPGCDSAMVSFTNNSSNATSYFWNFGDGNTSTATSPNHVYHTSGTYYVTLIGYGPGGCNDTIIHQVNITVVNNAVSSAFVADTFHGCAPLTVNFTNNSTGGTSYLWNFGDGNSANTMNATHTYTHSGIYTVKLVTYNNTPPCPISSDSSIQVNIIQVDTPLVIKSLFSGEPLSGCVPLLVNFTNNSTSGATYSWNFGDGFYDTLKNPKHFYIDSGTYIITLEAFIPGSRCSVSKDSMKISVHADSCELVIPNVFSPNGDGRNDFFNLIASGYKNYHLLIFDRWGLKLFESNDKTVLWNGKITNNGSDAPDGTYFFIFNATDPYDVPLSQKGSITLIR